MDETTGVKAPGKILLVGGYSILKQGNISYVVSIDKYVHACAQKKSSGDANRNPAVELKSVGATGEYDTDLFGPKTPEFKFANRAIWTFYSIYRDFERDVILETWNDSAFGAPAGKTGLGSSAASVVAMVGALFRHHFGALDVNTIHAISQYVHYTVQGAGSGFDVASACFGSIKYSRFGPGSFKGRAPDKVVGVELDCTIEPLPFPADYGMLYIPLGKSVSSAERIAKINVGEKNLDALNEANIKCIESLYSPKEFFREMRTGRDILEGMAKEAGFALLEPQDRQLLEKLDREGLAVSPGAGGESLVFLAADEGSCDKAKEIINESGLKYIQLGEAIGLRYVV